VIGVVEHIRMHDLSRAVRPQVYRPFGAGGRPGVVIRAAVAPAAISHEIEMVMKRLDPDMPLDQLQPMSVYVSNALAQTRLGLVVMLFFGSAALLLSCIGIYGVFSYAVSQRTREIGIRMALGQTAASVRNQVLAEALRLSAVSTGLGLAAALLITRSVASLLYDVKPADPATFASMAGLLIAAALAGCYVPAHRATRVNPIVALKAD